MVTLGKEGLVDQIEIFLIFSEFLIVKTVQLYWNCENQLICLETARTG